jgi:hypothetical protein
MNLLQILQAVTAELTITQPQAVVGSQDLQTVQLLALAQREGNELYRWPDNGWTSMQAEWTINVLTPVTMTGDIVEGSTVISNLASTAGLTAQKFIVTGEGMPGSQRVTEIIDGTSVRVEIESSATAVGTSLQFVRDTYAVPTDFDHYQSDTWWDRTNFWRLIGPISPQIDQWDRSGIVTTGPRRRWRQIGRGNEVFRLWPAPSTQDAPATLVFEYISNGWVLTQAGVYQNSFTADTDEFALNPQMMIMGVKWRWLQANGFQYEAMQAEYTDFVNRELARDGGASVLSLVRMPRQILLSDENIQDGNWPGPV